MGKLYPLRFEPIYRRYLWGGRNFATVLGRSLDEGQDYAENYAESWEIVDHGNDQSTVLAGPLTGTTLHTLVEEYGSELLGRHSPQQALQKRFPLLFKFLDAQKNLSLQVHPNDQQAQKLDPPDLGKTEAWVVLAAEPGSKVYAGLKPGVDREQLAQHATTGIVDQCVHQFEPRAGDCLLLEAGTVHAVGAGLLIAEIQQSSDTTYRLFDWNRLGTDGQPRELHIEQSLATIDFARGPVSAQIPQPTGTPGCERLVECNKFILDRWQTAEPFTCGGDDRCHLLAIVEGTAKLAGDMAEAPFQKGCSALLPASCGTTEIRPQGRVVVLDMVMP